MTLPIIDLRRKAGWWLVWVAAIVLLLAAACTPNRTYETTETISGQKWYRSDTLAMQVAISDTSASYNLFFVVRHTNDFPFRNLWMRLYTYYPSGKTGMLREQVILGDNATQQWLTDCLQNTCNGLIPIVEGLKFSEVGTYRFTVHHIMRTNPLPGIMDVGLRLERQP